MPDSTRQPSAPVRDRLRSMASPSRGGNVPRCGRTGTGNSPIGGRTAGVSDSYVYDICDSLAVDGFVASTTIGRRRSTRDTPVGGASAQHALTTEAEYARSGHRGREYHFEVVVPTGRRQTAGATHRSCRLRVSRRSPTRRSPCPRPALPNSGAGHPGRTVGSRVEQKGRLYGLADAVRIGLDGAPSLLRRTSSAGSSLRRRCSQGPRRAERVTYRKRLSQQCRFGSSWAITGR